MTVEALRRRRPEALDDLLATYGKQIQGVAYLILRDRADAEDVVVETLLTAYERPATCATKPPSGRGS
jgi:DNA-directed RNA polymerase specialized sigma24 family protein